MMHTHFLRGKSDVPEHVNNFVTFTERQTGLRVKRVRLDNRGEYCNEDLDRFVVPCVGPPP